MIEREEKKQQPFYHIAMTFYHEIFLFSRWESKSYMLDVTLLKGTPVVGKNCGCSQNPQNFISTNFDDFKLYNDSWITHPK